MFWDDTQRKLLVSYQNFGKNYIAAIFNSKAVRGLLYHRKVLDRLYLQRRQIIAHMRFETSHNSVDTIYSGSLKPRAIPMYSLSSRP